MIHSFGAAVPQKSHFVNSKKLDDDDKPLAVFSFKYRDRKALQSLLIIPRTPSPEPEAADSDGDNDDSFNLANLDPKQRKKLMQVYRDLQVRCVALSLRFNIADAMQAGQRQYIWHDQERRR
jgi:anionic cell wall polymer biosynthesis LytR-Cps2A-Psr (LCP) family protein